MNKKHERVKGSEHDQERKVSFSHSRLMALPWLFEEDINHMMAVLPFVIVTVLVVLVKDFFSTLLEFQIF